MADRDSQFEQAMHEAREGSREALGDLLESCRAYLLLVANKEIDPTLRQKVAASDIVQNTFVRARRKFEDFRGDNEAHWRGWVRQILIRDLQDTRRNFAGTRKRQLDRELPMASVDDSQRVNEPAAHAPTPQSHAIEREEAKLLRAAMNSLPEHHRLVVQLRNWEFLSFEEIGLRMGKSGDAARKLWSRAIERLQDELERKVQDSGR